MKPLSVICSSVVIIAIVTIAAASKPQQQSSKKHQSFHTLPSPPSLKLRGASSKPVGHSNSPADPPVSVQHAPAWDTNGDSDADDGDVEGALSTTFDPAQGADDDVAAGRFPPIWICFPAVFPISISQIHALT
jgi:hypothetical protein